MAAVPTQLKNPKPRLPKQTYKCGLVTPEAKQLMANARSAKRNELPWMVGIYDSESGHVQLICGGTIISETAILLSAHCLVKNDTVRRHAADIKVGAGKLFSDWNAKMDDHAQKFDVKKIILHKDFAGSEGNLDHDIALIILKKDIVFQSNIRPACLNFNPEIVQKQLQAGNRGLVAGWGLNENGTTSPTLQVAELPFVPLDVCAYSFPVNYQEFLTEDKFCAGYTNGTAVCQGDSGGGMAFPWLFQGEVRYIVQGITSSSPDANPKLPCDPYWRTIFTQISKYDKFIRYNVNDLVIPVL